MLLTNVIENLNVPYLQKIKDFINQNDIKTLPTGRYELGDNCFVNVSEYSTINNENIVFEAHKKYIDVQYLVYGSEKVYIIDKKSAQLTKQYDDVEDYELYKSKENKSKIIKSGDFIVFLPEELHSPSHDNGNISKVKKCVFKIMA